MLVSMSKLGRLRRLSTGLISTMIVIAGVLFLPGTVANAGPAHDQFRLLVNHHTRLCLAWHYVVPVSVDADNCTTNNYDTTQLWFGEGGGSGELHVYYLNEPSCLDSNAQGRVYMLGCNGGAFQKWDFTVVRNTTPQVVRIKNVATGRYLDGNAAGSIYTSLSNSGDYQQWDQYFNCASCG